MALTRERVIRFEGACNVRDLGGLPAAGGQTRFGVVYRGDGLSRLSESDVERFGALGIRTVLDLRFDEEFERAPDRLPGDDPPAVYRRGMHPQGSVELFSAVNDDACDARTAIELMSRNYARIPFEHANEFRDLMEVLISTGSAPHFIHCTSGKDRTGILVALVLRAVGVPVEAVLDDYELSNVEHQPVDVFGRRARPDAIAAVMAANRVFLRATLDAIDERCGSVDAYLGEQLAFGAAERRALEALLVGGGA